MITERTMKTLLSVACGMLAALSLCGGLAPSAHAAPFSLQDVGGAATLDGSFSRQAGAHPDLTTAMRFPSTRPAGGFFELPDGGGVHSVQVDLPPGIVGDPTAAPTCSVALLVAGNEHSHDMCPTASQVGIASVSLTNPNLPPVDVGVYNIERPDNLPGLFAFNFRTVVVRIEPSVRAGDYGITAKVNNISQAERLFGTRLTLWGVPADASHDADRFIPDFDNNGRGTSTLTPRRPFLTSPTSCSGKPLTTTVRADSWDTPGVFETASFDHDFDGTPFTIEGCDRLAFAPSFAVQPQSHLADAPTGLDFDLSIPQNDDPGGLATAQMRKAVVTFPEGMSVSPSSAAGLGACSPAQIDLATTTAPTCPDSSKIGTISIDTPLLDQPLTGDVILASQNDNPFRSLLALYLVAKGPGIELKIPGRVDPDPVTGQLTATFDNAPQLPFSHLRVTLRGGSKAALATPTTCGRYTTHAAITSWASSAPVQLDTPMDIDEGCEPRALATLFSAGSTNPVAGGSSPFTFTVTRADRSAYLSRIDAVLPAGMLARIASVEQCPEALAAAGACGPGSLIGSTSVLSGPGETPLPLTGRVYLTGPYKDAPFGLSIVVPTAGQAGPFDLGDVVVRAGIYVDRTDAHVTVKSDPLPRIIDGFPLRLRQVSMSIDRDGFMLNPTNCGAKTIFGAFESFDAVSLTQAAPYRATGCGELPVDPKLSISLSGKTSTTDGTHPGLKAHVALPAGSANLAKASVQLPLALALDPDNAQGLCKPEQRAALSCPASTIVGHATAKSVLPDPLTGPVYFVEATRKSASGRTIHTFPDLWIPLSADGVTIDLVANSDVVLDRLQTTFANLPDAPIDSFDLSIDGGKHGILVVSGKDGTCNGSKTVDSQFVGQNGETERDASAMSVAGCKARVLKTKTTKKSVQLQIGGLVAGKVTVTGKGVSRTSRTIKSASSAWVTAKLTKTSQKALSHHHRVRVTLAATFKPAKGAAVKLKKTVTVRS
jgi:hypothetical protein